MLMQLLEHRKSMQNSDITCGNSVPTSWLGFLWSWGFNFNDKRPRQQSQHTQVQYYKRCCH